MSVTSLKVFETDRVLLTTTLLIESVHPGLFTSRFCIICFNHVDASRCFCIICFCVYGSSLYVCMYLCTGWLGMARHVTVHCLQNGVDDSKFLKVVTFSAKKSRGCYHHRDILRFPAILVEKSDDFCYNRDEKRRKSRVSRVLSHPQVVGNAITSTIATRDDDKMVKRKIN